MDKRPDQSKYDLGRIKDWLEKDKFKINFGIATDGLHWIFYKYDRPMYAGRMISAEFGRVVYSVGSDDIVSSPVVHH